MRRNANVAEKARLPAFACGRLHDRFGSCFTGTVLYGAHNIDVLCSARKEDRREIRPRSGRFDRNGEVAGSKLAAQFGRCPRHPRLGSGTSGSAPDDSRAVIDLLKSGMMDVRALFRNDLGSAAEEGSGAAFETFDDCDARATFG